MSSGFIVPFSMGQSLFAMMAVSKVTVIQRREILGEMHFACLRCMLDEQRGVKQLLHRINLE